MPVLALPSASVPPAETFALGSAKNPAGSVIGVDSLSLLLDGRRWMPVMGELHYTRVPAEHWREELLKMKAGGIFGRAEGKGLGSGRLGGGESEGWHGKVGWCAGKNRASLGVSGHTTGTVTRAATTTAVDCMIVVGVEGDPGDVVHHLDEAGEFGRGLGSCFGPW